MLCTDGRNPSRASDWATFAARNDSTAPGFAGCDVGLGSLRSSTWTVQTRTPTRGPFTRDRPTRCSIVGNY